MQGITEVHVTSCPRRADRDAACRCEPSYRATARTLSGERVRRQFKTRAEARGWKIDIEAAKRRGAAIAIRAPIVAVAADELVAGMKSGAIRNRSGDLYKPTVIYDYEHALNNDVRPVLGAKRLDEVRRADVVRLIERLQARGVSPSRMRNVLMPLRVIYRRAIEFEQVASNPVARIPLPAVRGKRDRIATPKQAERMIAALAPADRAPWALAFYAGLRLGELRGLRWADVDTDAGLIHVRRAWCNRSGRIVAPKSATAIRQVPMAGRLRQLLLEHRLLAGRPGPDDVVVASRTGTPLTVRTLDRRRTKTWEGLDDVPADLTMHEARHTYASLMIAAGVPHKPLAEFMGHSSITITIDRYGHLFPGAHAEAADLLDRYLDAHSGRSR